MLINKNTVTAEDRKELDQQIEQTVKERNCSRPQAIWLLFQAQEKEG